MPVYTRIKEIATNQGMSIRKVERLSGLSNGIISKWDKHDPRVASVKKVADVLGVSIEKVLTDKT